MTDVGESVGTPAPPQKCPPHEWEEKGREKPDDTKAKNDANATVLESKPSKAHQAKGPRHENNAIDKNMTKMPIEATSVKYKCRICGADQEVDILGQNNQVAEAKSQNAKGVKNSSSQCKNYSDIQRQLNEEKGTSNQPLAKVDQSRPDTADSQAIYTRRGFAVEGV
jgi:hypothetical protein